MFKRKRKSSEYDDSFLPPLPDEGSEYNVEGQNTKKRKQGCIFTLVGAVLLLVCSFTGYRAYQHNLALRPLPTPTLPPDDGQPIPVESGLLFAEYAVNGQQTGIYDLEGQVVSSSENIPISLPVSIAEDPLEGLNAIAYPEGAFYDASSGQLVVLGPPAQADASTSSDDFLTALRAVYAGEYPGVSIDPAGSETVQSVRYIGQTENTHFGWVMFEADRRMKTLSMGQDNISGASVTSSVPGFANMFDLEFQLGSPNQNEVRRRFWFKVPSVEIEQTTDGQAMFITALSLAVDTEYLDANWQTSKSQPPDPAGQAFAAHLTDHYDGYASEFPVFDDLKTLARWTALAHWLKQADLPIQPELWLAESPSPYSAAPLTTPAITATRQSEQGNFIQTLTMWGGVSLEMAPKIRPAQEATLGQLQELTNKFKAWTGSASVETVGQGISFTPLASSGIQYEVSPIVDFPLPLAPPLQLTSNGWVLRTPRLTSQESTFILDDPARPQPLVLSYQGFDADTNADVFADTEHGLRLVVYADGYQLLFGEFQGEHFSYYENDYMVFDLEGNILNDMKTGTVYEYSGRLLKNIQQGGRNLEITFDHDNRLQQLKSADGEANLVYDNGLLMSVSDASGQPIRKFVYDERNRLVREIGANGNDEKMFRYDDQDRILYQIENGSPILYDWHENNTLTRISGNALLPWQNAEVKDLTDLTVLLRLRRSGIVDQTLFTRQVDDKLVVMLNDQSYTLPIYMLQNPPALRRKLAAVLRPDDKPDEIVLISEGRIQGVFFQSLFPEANIISVETVDEKRVLKNLALIPDSLSFTPETASIVNAIPLSTQLANIGLDPEEADLWLGAREKFTALITQFDYDTAVVQDLTTQIPLSLADKPSVLIVIAHSDGARIYLPDSMPFDPEKLTDQQKEAIKERAPLVILFSCDTAKATDSSASLSQKLLDLGVRMVIAPNGELPVDDAHILLETFLNNLKTNTDALQALKQAIQSIYPDGLLPKQKDGLDRFFKSQVQNVPLNKQENQS